MLYTHTMEYYSPIKVELNNATCSRLDGPRDCHTKQTKSEKERQIPHDIMCMWNLKHKTSEQTKQNRNGLGDTEQTGGCQKG